MKSSHFSKDTQEFCRILGKNKVKYVIVGGEAVIYYGYARLTGDVDFFYDLSKENAMKLHNALHEFWHGDIPGLSRLEELMEPGTILQFGAPPNRIDLINSIDRVSFKEAWESGATATLNLKGKAIEIYFIGLDELIKNKEAMKRPKDLEDLKYLLGAREQKI